MTAKEYFKQAQTLDRRIDCKLEQLERLKSLRERTTTVLSDMPRSKGEIDRLNELTCRVIELEHELNDEIDRFVDLKIEIREAIELIQDERYRTLLELRYLNNNTWEQIAEKMRYEVRHVTRLHGNALVEAGKMSCFVHI